MDPETPTSDTIMRPMSVYGDLGKNHDPGGSQRKPLTDQPRSKNRYKGLVSRRVVASDKRRPLSCLLSE